MVTCSITHWEPRKGLFNDRADCMERAMGYELPAFRVVPLRPNKMELIPATPKYTIVIRANHPYAIHSKSHKQNF